MLRLAPRTIIRDKVRPLAARRTAAHRNVAMAAMLAAIVLLFRATLPLPSAAQDAPAEFERPGQALIRVMHTSPDAPALDLYVGDRIVTSGLVMGDVTGFLPAPDGEQALRFVPTGGSIDTAIVETRFDLMDGGAYEVVALGQLREIDGRIYEVDRSRFAEPGMARLRFLHFSPDAAEVDVSIASDSVLFDGADFADATGYTDLSPGRYTVSIRSADPALASAQPLATADVDVSAGVVYDIAAIGLSEQNSFGLLPLTASSDVPCGVLLGGGGAGDACVRVVHASADTPAFDLYVDDSEAPVVQGISFASASSFVAVPAGERTIRLEASGSVDGETLREAKVDLTAGQAYDLAAMDLRDQLDVRPLELDLSPLGGGQARLRFVHAMPNQSGLTLALTSGETIYPNLEFPNVSPSIEVTVVPLEISVLPAAPDGNALATLGVFDPAPGTEYVLFVIGDGNGAVASMLILPAPVTPASGLDPAG